LLPGDVIYIPPVGPLVALAGSVNVPAIYELKETATLGEAIALAGGLASTASSQKVVFERIEKHTIRKVEEFALLDIALGRELKDGDLVRVFSLSPRFENAVTLRGNVAMPGRYEWRPGLRIRDLIPEQNALITRDYWQRNNLSVTASVQVSRSVPEVNWDYAVVQRLNSADLSSRLIPFNLGKAVLENDPGNNILLEVGDVVTVFSQGDLAVPLERRTKFVRLEGEFRAAGVYRVEAGETLRQLVKRAGGLTPTAYLYGAEFTRESARVQQQKGLDEFARNLDQELARNSVAPLGTTPEEAKEMAMRLQAERQLIDKLRQVKAAGRLVLELKPQTSGVDALPDLELEDGDSLLIPHCPAAVSVLGAVYNRNSFLYRSNRRVGHYLELAGGPTRDADKGRMFILRADGSVLSKQSLGGGLWGGSRFDGLRLMPGDAVVVPERLNRGTGWRAVRDWSMVFSQFALGAAAISVIR
jgi:protein involved in polysaccharide export with SLBB domain